MPQNLLVAVLAGIGGMLGWGFADFFAKKTIDQIGDMASLAWGHIFGTLILVLVAVYQIARGQHITIPHSLTTWSLLIFFGIAQALVYLLLYRGFSKGQIAILNPVFASFSGITAILSIVIFREVIKNYLGIGLVILFIGVILMSLDIKALRLRRISFSHVPGMREVIFATLLAATWTLSWSKFVEGKDWVSYALFMYAFMTAAILVIAKYQHSKLLTIKRSMWKFLVMIGICETVAYLAISIGYGTSSLTSIIAVLSGAFSLPTIILARLFLKEKISASQTVGGIVIVAGIMVISLL